MSKSGNVAGARIEKGERIEMFTRDASTVGTYSPEDTGFNRFGEITG